MLEVLRNLILTKPEAILLGAVKEAIKHPICFFLWPNIEVIICESHQQPILDFDVLILQAGKVEGAEYTRDVKSLRDS